MKKNHWKATFHSQKADWTWIQDNMAVTSFANSQVEFNGCRYPGVILGVSEYEGHPVSGMDLGGLVNVDIEYFDWQYGKSAGKVRYTQYLLLHSSALLFQAVPYTIMCRTVSIMRM